ncbi:SIR2 family NAD-dependent protein deacylase [Portibacter marinus]|uniref:SIR2 family NAD-dependent protein deacylase n=1 Tax=Portibacter marinus TaxID=2898660 RepID=UPI001F23F59C|nr:NAD-dependent deacylase [Portibacter marinus]
MTKKNLTVLSGAGISVASGLKTFRGEGGLWEGYDIMKVASIEGWEEDPELVLEFYNKRRSQLKTVKPNDAHQFCAKLEEYYNVTIVTQNVDDLHERAGSRHVIHLHGELKKIKSSKNPHYVQSFDGAQKMGDLCPQGGQMRPDVVWFGEAVPKLDHAAAVLVESEIVIIVGTSMQVYPAAGLISYAPRFANIFYIDPDPAINYELSRLQNLRIIQQTAEEGMRTVYEHLTKE